MRAKIHIAGLLLMTIIMTTEGDGPEELDTDSHIDEILNQERDIFRNKEILEPSKIPDPGRIVGRKQEIEDVVHSLEDLIHNDSPESFQIYGKTGTGKSLVSQYVGRQITERAKEQGVRTAYFYVGCDDYSTYYRTARHLYKSVWTHLDNENQFPDFADTKKEEYELLPSSGLGAERHMDEIKRLLNEFFDGAILIIDEIDLLEPSNINNMLQKLTRVLSDEDYNTHTSLIVISNRPSYFKEILNRRVKSSMSDVEFVFRPYEAGQIEEILNKRRDAFQEGVLSDDMIKQTARHSAEENGDARKAIKLIRTAGMQARREDANQVTHDHLESAKTIVEADIIARLISRLTKQSHIVLYALTRLLENGDEWHTTEEIRDRYEMVARDIGKEPRKYTRVVDYLNELAFLDITKTKKEGGPGEGVEKSHKLAHQIPVTKAAILKENSVLLELESIDEADEIFTDQ